MRHNKRLPTISHNWQTKALAVLSANNLPNKVHLLKIAHDDWCDMLHDRGFCNCDPSCIVKRVTDAEDN